MVSHDKLTQTVLLDDLAYATVAQADLTIDGESAIVTASGSGIGREIAAQLAESGVDVCLNDIDSEALDQTAADFASLEGDVVIVEGDASNPKCSENLVEETKQAFDTIDIIVNNVGVAGPTKPCEEIDYEEFMGTIKTNLGSLFNLSREAIPHVKRGNYGRIVNISSISGKRPLRDRTPYTTSKMGVVGFTRTLAAELASEGVNVNAICPGSVEGPRLNAVIEGQAKSQGRPVEVVREEFQNSSPMEEFVQDTDIADAVLFFCSERAERITGQDLNVSAGNVMY